MKKNELNTVEQNDVLFMKRCLQLASLGRGQTAPNPMVGSVVVYNNKIIGEGFHEQYGQAHAEVNAIASVQNHDLLCESTLYVNLEPCSHHGKTPPCADLIVKKGLKRVVVGCIDSFSKVAGKGVEHIRKNGIEVTVGILEKESRELNARFFTFHEKKRPYILLKWAQTQDGFIDIASHLQPKAKGLWISNDLCKTLVHKWRTEEQSILVGTNTAQKDNPELNARQWCGKNPTRLVLDRNGRLPHSLHLFDGTIPTIVFTELSKTDSANILYKKIDFSNLWDNVFSVLHSLDIQSVIIEGGAQVLNSLIEQNKWDEARVFIGNLHFYDGVAAPKLKESYCKEEFIDSVRLLHYVNKISS